MMGPLERWLTNGSTFLVAGSGIVYGVMKYLMRSDDPYAVVNHPLQPWALDLHVVAAPLLVFALGMMMQHHIVGQLSRGAGRSGRGTGLVAVFCMAPMVATGYLIQVFTNDRARLACVVVHIVTGVVYTLMFLAHVVRSRRQAARRRSQGDSLDVDDSGATTLLRRVMRLGGPGGLGGLRRGGRA